MLLEPSLPGEKSVGTQMFLGINTCEQFKSKPQTQNSLEKRWYKVASPFFQPFSVVQVLHHMRDASNVTSILCTL
jgi:hypothetical protein